MKKVNWLVALGVGLLGLLGAVTPVGAQTRVEMTAEELAALRAKAQTAHVVKRLTVTWGALTHPTVKGKAFTRGGNAVEAVASEVQYTIVAADGATVQEVNQPWEYANELADDVVWGFALDVPEVVVGEEHLLIVEVVDAKGKVLYRGQGEFALREGVVVPPEDYREELAEERETLQEAQGETSVSENEKEEANGPRPSGTVASSENEVVSDNNPEEGETENEGEGEAGEVETGRESENIPVEGGQAAAEKTLPEKMIEMGVWLLGGGLAGGVVGWVLLRRKRARRRNVRTPRPPQA